MDQAARSVSPRLRTSALLAVLLVGLVLAVAGWLSTTLGILLAVFAGLIFGVFVNGLSRWLTRRTPLGYRVSYFIVVLLILAVLVGGFYYLGSQVGQRVAEFRSQLQSAAQQATEKLQQYEWAQQYLPEPQDLRETATQSGGSLLPGVLQGLQWLMWGVTGALVILFVGFYAAYEPQLYRQGVIKLAPRERRPRIAEVLDELRTSMGSWITGRLISMIIVGVITAVGLWWLGVPLPITLGVLAALLTFIPNLGPFLAAVPQVLLALNVGTDTALYVIIFNLVLQGVESYLITPLIQRHEVSLPPVLTLAAQLTMGVWIGVIGVMMAAPLVVVTMVLLQMLYIQDRLGDPDPGELVREH